MIRFIEEKDRHACFEMLTEFYSTDAVSHAIPNEYITNSITNALDNSPYIKILVCEPECNYAGFCALSFTHSTEAGGMVVLIEEIYIRDQHKGKGYGTAIINYIRKEYDNYAKRYRLEVTPHNQAAIKLYERLGFVEVSYNQMILDI